jgi:hypothetical protein
MLMKFNEEILNKIRFNVLFIIGTIAFISLWNNISGEPKNLQEAELFTSQSISIINKIGPVKKVQLKKWRSVSAAGEIPGYREFDFDIYGERKNATATVHAELFLNEDKVNRYTIKYFEIVQ